jgi:SET domain-containing protein
VIIAKKEIFIGDELSYDYQFEFEENGEKLPCKCGAPSCIGRLN